MDHDPQLERKLFYEGLELFNTGEWFEAHEVWEDIWHMAGGDRKRFYQGLIQVAVTLEHVRRGNPRGVRSVHRSCMSKFDGLPDVFMGIDVVKLKAELNRCVGEILNLPEELFAPDLPRGQDLPFDWDRVMKIELVADPFE